VVEPAAAEVQFLTLVNRVRTGRGQNALVRDPGLDAVARDWSGHMAATFARSGIVIRPGVKQHTIAPDCEVDALCHRPNLAEAVGSVEPSWRSAGENVGTGGEVVSLHEAFVASPGHFANIVGTYNRVGVGVVIENGTIWVTFNFLDGPALTPLANGAQRVGGTAPGTATALAPAARFVPVDPRRVLDTRPSGVTVPAGGTVTIDLAGPAGPERPAGATAAALNVTATEPGADGFLTVFPCGRARPLASNLNYRAGQTVPNNVLVALGDSGRVCVFALTRTHVVVDLNGWYTSTPGAAATGLVTAAPTRLVDTRTSGGRRQDLVVSLDGAVPPGVTAVTLNVTVADPLFDGYLTVYPCGDLVPLASNLNFVAGQTVPNLVTVKVGTGHRVCAYANVPTNVVVDLAGWFTAGDKPVVTVAPTRLLDTRDGTGGWLNALAAGQTIDLDVAGTVGIPDGAAAAHLNVTVTGGATGGFLTVFPCGTPRPLASNLNYAANQTVANAVVVPLGGGQACFYASTPVHVIADVAAYTA
jgi:hypothetical protein